ncbi:OmpH family outer membrane protein [Haliangium sp.]|uniref:OmpH family outer membrane protein n=1 Tax=Haliangium sp. TaxID=2663208 RepID=UPI003D11564D
MHKSLAIAFLGVAFIIAGMVSANAGPGGAVKIGFVDLQQVMLQSAAGKRARNKFEKSGKQKQAQFDKKRKELEKYDAELQKQASVLKEDVLRERVAERQKKALELQQLSMQLERALAEEEAKLLQQILSEAEPVLKKLAVEKGFSLILARQMVLWTDDDALDLTAELSGRMK